MKRLIQPIFILGFLFLFGVSSAHAAEPIATGTIVLAENTRYEMKTQKLIVIGGADLLLDPTFNTWLTSYGTHPINLHSFFGGLSSHDKNAHPAIQVFETSVGSVQSGGTAGTGGADGETTTVIGGGIVTTTTPASPLSSSITSDASTTSTASNSSPSSITSIASNTSSSNTSTTQTPTPKTLKLVELYPNTTGNDNTEEYVRIKNTGSEPVNLNGWMLKDASGKISKLSGLDALSAGATIQLYRSASNLALNNDTDTVFLIAPDEQVVDQVSYEKTMEGETYRYTDTGWQWPTPTVIATPIQPTPVSIALPQPIVAVSAPSPLGPNPSPLTPNPFPIVSPTTLQLDEIYPSTTEGDETAEYVVIKNTGTEPVALEGWTLKDASDKTYTFTQTDLLAAGAILKLPRSETKLTLNNDADELTLLSPAKELIDQLSYDNASKGETYKRTQNIWHWSSDVPSAQSTTISQLPVDTTPVSPTSSTNNTNESGSNIVKTNQNNTVEQVLTQPDGTIVELTATITVLPGVLGKQFFYVQQNDSAIQVYKNDAIFPELQLGQSVRVVGELSTVAGERRLKITKTGIIEPLALVEIVPAKKRSLTEIPSAGIGSLTQITATVKDISGNLLIVEDDGKNLDVSIGTYTQIDTSGLTPGTKLQVSGIVRASASGFKLMPRFQEDIVVLEHPSTTPLGSTVENGKTLGLQQEQKTALLLAGSSAIILIGWIMHQFILRKQTLYADHALAFGTEKVH